MKIAKIFFILLLSVSAIAFGSAAFAGDIVVYGDSQVDEVAQRRVVEAILQKKPSIAFRVGDIVNDGHDHNYQRFLYNRIDYIVTGGGGSPLHDQVRTSPYLQKFSKTYHFCLLSPDRDSLTAKVFDVDLNLIDEFTIPSIGAEKPEPNSVVYAP